MGYPNQQQRERGQTCFKNYDNSVGVGVGVGVGDEDDDGGGDYEGGDVRC